MDKELKSVVVEIIVMVLLLIIVIPICVKASSDYQNQKEALSVGNMSTIDIVSNEDMKRVIVYSNYNDSIKVNLFFRITKFSNDYDIYFDGSVYNLNNLEYKEDDEYFYYCLGIYEIDKTREFDFKLIPKGKIYYDEAITYSFVTEGLL